MNEKNEGDLNILKEKVSYFFKGKVLVHISLNNGYWKRGYVTEISDLFFMLDETLEGLQPIFFQELKNIEPWRKKE